MQAAVKKKKENKGDAKQRANLQKRCSIGKSVNNSHAITSRPRQVQWRCRLLDGTSSLMTTSFTLGFPTATQRTTVC